MAAYLTLSLADAEAQTLTITAKGTVPPVCGVASQGGFPSANLDSDGTISAAAQFSCNTPFRVRAASGNGGLANAAAAPAGFVNRLDYSLNVAVPLDGGTVLTGACGSAALVAGSAGCALSPASTTGLSSGAATAISKTATLTVSWVRPTATRLVAGTYADILTITVTAQQ